MEYSLDLKGYWKYVVYGLIVLSFITLFFTSRFEGSYALLLKDIDITDVTSAVTLNKTMLCILDICLMIIAFTPLKDEDERVEKIRNYATKNVFILSMLTAIIVGFFMNSSTGIMVYVACILSYYILLFRLCLYYDPKFVYMSPEEERAYGRSMKKYNIWALIQVSIVPGIAHAVIDKLHHPEYFWPVILINIYVLALVKTVYFSRKG